MNPQDKILKHFKSGKSLTVLTALTKFHTTELRKIVSRLCDKGYIIDSEYNVYHDKRFKRYWMRKVS